MEKLTVTAAQKELINLVESVTEENKVYEIEISNGSAVLISRKNYESLQETLELLSIWGLDEFCSEKPTVWPEWKLMKADYKIPWLLNDDDKKPWFDKRQKR